MSIEPSSVASERGLLGIIIGRNETLYEVSQSIVAADFYESLNGEIYNLLRDLIEAGRQVTAGSLVHDAADGIVWGDVRASQYIHDIEREAPPAAVISGLARTIRELARRRQLIALGKELQSLAVDAPVSISADELRAKRETGASYVHVIALRRAGYEVYRAGSHHKVNGSLVDRRQLAALAAMCGGPA